MNFGDLSSRSGVQLLNNFLQDKSYLDGYQPSQADNVVFDAMKKAPDGDLFHAVRWYTHINSFSETERKAFAASAKKLEAAASAPAKKVEDDDEVDLFGDDDEEDQAEQERIKAERIAAYEAKKSKKPALIAKSSVMLDVKPWDDETDMKALEESVRSIEMDGLLWGSSKLVTIAFGIKKLQITCVVEDDKVSTEELDERICAFEDFVQSVDIVSFNKI